MLSAIGFDGDDTLWQSETVFAITQERVRALLADHVDPVTLDERLLEVERANLAMYGYGAKSFTLSLIETAVDLAGSALKVSDIQALLDAGKELLSHPVELLPGAQEAVVAAKACGLPVLLITKGDLFHQESKVARSGLGELVDSVEVVHEKDEATYGRVLGRHGISPEGFLMVGNSLRSDSAPVLALGGWAAYIPHDLTWALERPEDETPITDSERFRSLTSLSELRDLIAELLA